MFSYSIYIVCIIYTISHIYEFQSVIKENEIMSFTGKWLELETIMVGKIRQI